METSEQYRKKFADQLREALSGKDRIVHDYESIKSSKILNDAKYEIIEEQLKFLYGALEELANAKNLQDKFQFKVDAQEV